MTVTSLQVNSTAKGLKREEAEVTEDEYEYQSKLSQKMQEHQGRQKGMGMVKAEEEWSARAGLWRVSLQTLGQWVSHVGTATTSN